ncbi:MAG: hypothetical protein ACTHJM_05655 [Marmoricola sp.]
MATNRGRRGSIAPLAGATVALIALVSGCGTVAAPKASSTSSFCTGTGVNVVIDFGSMGGVKKGCGQGKTAQAVIESAGFKLGTKASSYGPFACTVNGLPADKKCDGKPTYWGLFVGKPGKAWGYASLGIGTQPAANGDTIALAWQTSSKTSYPSVQPASAK